MDRKRRSHSLSQLSTRVLFVSSEHSTGNMRSRKGFFEPSVVTQRSFEKSGSAFKSGCIRMIPWHSASDSPRYPLSSFCEYLTNLPWRVWSSSSFRADTRLISRDFVATRGSRMFLGCHGFHESLPLSGKVETVDSEILRNIAQ